MFGLDGIHTVDGGKMGNETRFINHASSDYLVNCVARSEPGYPEGSNKLI